MTAIQSARKRILHENAIWRRPPYQGSAYSFLVLLIRFYEGVRLTHQTSNLTRNRHRPHSAKIEANDPRGWSALHWLRGALLCTQRRKSERSPCHGPGDCRLGADRALPQLPLAGPQQSARLVLTLSVVSLGRLEGVVTEQRVQRRFCNLGRRRGRRIGTIEGDFAMITPARKLPCSAELAGARQRGDRIAIRGVSSGAK